MLEYHAAYTFHADSGWYAAEVLDFPGALSQGRTLEKARKMLRNGLQLLADYLLEEGKPLPRPDPAAADAQADVVEPIRLRVRVSGGGPP